MNFKRCKECTKRFPACHDTCEDYLQEKEEHEKLKKAKRLETEFQSCVRKLAVDRRSKWIKTKQK